MWHTGWFSTYSHESNKQKNQHEQVGTQNRAAQLSLARRGQRHRWIGHSTVRRNSNPLNTSMKNQKKRYKEKRGPTPEKIKNHKTHQPYGGDAPRDRVCGQRDDPMAAFWPKLVTPRGYSDGTWRAGIRGPSGGGTTTSTYQTGPQSARRTRQLTGENSPCWTGQLIKLEWAHTERATWFRDLMRGADWWRDITWGSLRTRGDSRGCPPWVHFLGGTPSPGASGWLVQGTDN